MKEQPNWRISQKRAHKENATGFRGIYYNEAKNRYKGDVLYNGVKFRTQWHETAEDAAREWDDITRRFGRNVVNFPKKGTDEIAASDYIGGFKEGCPSGHDQSFLHLDSCGRVACRMCNNIASRNYKIRHKDENKAKEIDLDTRERLRHEMLAMGINTKTQTICNKIVEFKYVSCSCQNCSETQEKRFSPQAFPNVVSLSFQSMGWEVTKKWSWTCPKCAAAKREKLLEPVTMSPAKPHSPIKPDAIANVRAPTVRETIAIADALAPLFDKGRYKAGHDDRSIGKDLELPAAMVAKVREELHGPIKGDPEIDAIKSDLADIVALTKELAQRVAATEKRICG